MIVKILGILLIFPVIAAFGYICSMIVDRMGKTKNWQGITEEWSPFQ
jgi:hypothetical protein